MMNSAANQAVKTTLSLPRRGRRPTKPVAPSAGATLAEIKAANEGQKPGVVMPPDAGQVVSEAHKLAASAEIPAARTSRETHLTDGGMSGSLTLRDDRYSSAPAITSAAHTAAEPQSRNGGEGGTIDRPDTHSSAASPRKGGGRRRSGARASDGPAESSGARTSRDDQTMRGAGGDGLSGPVTLNNRAIADQSAAPIRRDTQRLPGSDGGDQRGLDTQPSPISADLLATIGDLYKVRRSLLMAEGDMSRRIKSKQRSAATYRLRANGLEPEPGKLPTPTEADEAVVLKLYPAFFAALDTLKTQRMQEEKALIAEAEKLPIMAWAEKVRGLGAKSVATLVAEAGDPGRYSTPSKLWKRYGLAVIDDQRQRRMADAEEALRHGYNAQRRSAIFVIGGNLIRSGNPHARMIYEAVKAREIVKEGITKGHAHNRALRIVQKRLALAFWLAWRQVERGEPISDVPAAFAAEGA